MTKKIEKIYKLKSGCSASEPAINRQPWAEGRKMCREFPTPKPILCRDPGISLCRSVERIEELFEIGFGDPAAGNSREIRGLPFLPSSPFPLNSGRPRVFDRPGKRKTGNLGAAIPNPKFSN
jgi:hypothetical protein